MNLRHVSFTIQGMRNACANCAVTLEHGLMRLDGVIAAHVNYAAERATITFDPARVSLNTMVLLAQSEGFDVARQLIRLNVTDLIYASSGRTLEKVLARVEGVVQASADLKTQHIELDVLAEHVNYTDYANAIGALGLRVIDQSVQNAPRAFALRTFAIIVLALLSLVSAGAHASLFEAGILHAPLIAMIASVIAAYGIAGRFYRMAFDSALRGIIDVSVLIALVASISLFLGLIVALLAPTRAFTSFGFIVTILLTAGWFIVRALTVLIQPPTRLHQIASQPSLGVDHKIEQRQPSSEIGVENVGLGSQARQLLRFIMLPLLAGILASSGMLALYVLILTVFQDFSHAMQQATQDWFWIGLVAMGFGVQMGLYVYLRLLVDAAQAIGATAATSAGTTTSTLGMIACCAHHLTDLAPLVAFAGASNLSGAIALLNEWKYAFIALGLVVNALGIVITLRTIRKSRAHLSAMMDWFTKTEPEAALH